MHTTSEKFENSALFLRQGLPSTVIRYENGAFWKLTLFKPEKFENAALHVQLDLHVHTNSSRKWDFLKTLFKPEKFENVGRFVSLWRENIRKRVLDGSHSECKGYISKRSNRGKSIKLHIGDRPQNAMQLSRMY